MSPSDGDPIEGRPGWFWSEGEGRPVWKSSEVGGEWWYDERKSPTTPYAYIQWKGTDVCMDFRCPCGEGGHFDGMFAYVVECPACHKRFEMAWHVAAREVGPGSTHYEYAKLLEDD